MNRDLLILLKSIYENSNDRMYHILKVYEIVAVFNQNQLKGEQMMAVEEGLLKDKVSLLRPFFSIAAFDVDLLMFVAENFT